MGKRQRSVEERALRAILKQLALDFVAEVDDPDSDIMDLKEHLGDLVSWYSVVEGDDVAGTLRGRIHKGLSGLKPSEEEELEQESVEGTPLRALGLSTRVHNALCRSGDLRSAVGIPKDSDGYSLRIPFVEEVVKVLESGAEGMSGEEFLLSGYVRGFGPLALAELKEKLREHKFLPVEEPKGLPSDVGGGVLSK